MRIMSELVEGSCPGLFEQFEHQFIIAPSHAIWGMPHPFSIVGCVPVHARLTIMNFELAGGVSRKRPAKRWFDVRKFTQGS